MAGIILEKIYRRSKNFIKIQLNRKNLTEILNECSAKITGISFEVTNICNADCSFCAYRHMTRPKGVMPIGLYKKTLENCVEDGITTIALGTIVGDPLEDPFLLERIRFAAKSKEIKIIGFYTNLIGINRFDLKKFLLSGLTHITISTSFAGKDFYRRYFGVDRYDEVIDNIRRILGLNMSLGGPVNINIELRMPVWSFATLGRNPLYRKIAPMANGIDLKYHYHDWLGLIEKKDIPKGCRFLRKKNKYKMPCNILYGQSIIIMLDGKVNICGCVNFNADDSLIVGDINNNTLKNIWLGDRIKKMRKDWFEGEIPRLCEKCRFYESALYKIIY